MFSSRFFCTCCPSFPSFYSFLPLLIFPLFCLPVTFFLLSFSFPSFRAFTSSDHFPPSLTFLTFLYFSVSVAFSFSSNLIFLSVYKHFVPSLVSHFFCLSLARYSLSSSFSCLINPFPFSSSLYLALSLFVFLSTHPPIFIFSRYTFLPFYFPPEPSFFLFSLRILLFPIFSLILFFFALLLLFPPFFLFSSLILPPYLSSYFLSDPIFLRSLSPLVFLLLLHSLFLFVTPLLSSAILTAFLSSSYLCFPSYPLILPTPLPLS